MAHFRDRPRDREGRKEGRKEEDTNKVCGGAGDGGGRGIISIAPARASEDFNRQSFGPPASVSA